MQQKNCSVHCVINTIGKPLWVLQRRLKRKETKQLLTKVQLRDWGTDLGSKQTQKKHRANCEWYPLSLSILIEGPSRITHYVCYIWLLFSIVRNVISVSKVTNLLVWFPDWHECQSGERTPWERGIWLRSLLALKMLIEPPTWHTKLDSAAHEQGLDTVQTWASHFRLQLVQI